MTLLLVCCLSAANTVPLFLPKQHQKLARTVIDAHNDSLPADGKEEKTESLKFARSIFVEPIATEIVQPKRFCEMPRRSKMKIFLPVILPPPKAVA